MFDQAFVANLFDVPIAGRVQAGVAPVVGPLPLFYICLLGLAEFAKSPCEFGRIFLGEMVNFRNFFTVILQAFFFDFHYGRLEA